MIVKKILLSLIIFLFFFSSIYSQSITWTKVYGGSDDDIAYSVKQTPDGGYIVIGTTQSFGGTWLLKLDEYGDTVFSKNYSSIGAPLDIEVDYDSGYIFTGTFDSSSPTMIDILIVKTDENGDSIWSKIIPLYDIEEPYEIEKTTDSCYVVVGRLILQNYTPLITKLDRNGDTLWTNEWWDEQYYTSIQETYDNNFIVTVTGEPYCSMTLVKYDSTGNVIKYQSILTPTACDIEILNDSNYIIVSSSHLIKINSELDSIWSKTYAGRDATATNDGGFVIIGETDIDVCIIKFNTDGDSLWSAEYGGSGSDEGRSIEQTSDGGYIICGWTNSYGSGGSDFYIIKTDSLGYAAAVEENQINYNPEYFNISYISKQNGNIVFYFTLPQSHNVKLEIFDLSGRLISTPINDNFSKGEHEVDIILPKSGIYIYRFTSSNFEQSGKLLVF